MKFSSRPAEIKPALKRSILALSLAAGLGACGGGGGDGGGRPSGEDANSVPASAGASVAAFVNYLDRTPANETGEPLEVAITPPTTDTDEATDV